MSYLLFGVGLIVIGIIIVIGGSNTAYQAYLKAEQYLPDTLEYFEAVQSSEYPFGIGLMAFGGTMMIAGAFSIHKHRNSNNNS